MPTPGCPVPLRIGRPRHRFGGIVHAVIPVRQHRRTILAGPHLLLLLNDRDHLLDLLDEHRITILVRLGLWVLLLIVHERAEHRSIFFVVPLLCLSRNLRSPNMFKLKV